MSNIEVVRSIVLMPQAGSSLPHILLAQRNSPGRNWGKFEAPGGKVDKPANLTWEPSLKALVETGHRETLEEAGIESTCKRPPILIADRVMTYDPSKSFERNRYAGQHHKLYFMIAEALPDQQPTPDMTETSTTLVVPLDEALSMGDRMTEDSMIGLRRLAVSTALHAQFSFNSNQKILRQRSAA